MTQELGPEPGPRQSLPSWPPPECPGERLLRDADPAMPALPPLTRALRGSHSGPSALPALSQNSFVRAVPTSRCLAGSPVRLPLPGDNHLPLVPGTCAPQCSVPARLLHGVGGPVWLCGHRGTQPGEASQTPGREKHARSSPLSLSNPSCVGSEQNLLTSALAPQVWT